MHICSNGRQTRSQRIQLKSNAPSMMRSLRSVTPAHAIECVAFHVGCDLIVFGGHKRRAVQRLLAGSVA